MKTLLLIILFILYAFNCKSQSYIQFPDSNAVWKVVHQPYPPGPILWYSEHYNYSLSTDTSINEVQYSKLLRTDFDVQCSQIYTDPYYVGGIRNDSINKKIYYYPSEASHDYLLYDFNLEIGDTVPATYNNYSFPNLYVTFIDSILIKNVFHKRFYYYQYADPDSIGVIEGIGAETGLLEPLSYFDQIHNLRCFYQDDSLFYMNDNDTTCQLEIDTCLNTRIPEHDYSANNLRIFPNPCKDYVVIQNIDPIIIKKIEIQIVDITGKIIYKKQIMICDYYMIDLHIYCPGIYILSTSDDDNQNHRMLFLKN